MKSCFVLLALCITQILSAQDYTIELKTGNHDNIIAASYDRQRNELIALDKLGFIVCWNINNYSIINKFQLPPEGPYTDSRKQMLGKYEVQAFDSIITVSYPYNVYNTNSGERLVDLYHRRTGKFIMQTPLAKMGNVIFTKDATMITAIATTSKQGYVEVMQESTLTAIDRNNKAHSIALPEVPACIQADERTNRLAIGYRYGTVEIRDLKTFALIKTFNDFENDREKKINQLVFIPGSDQIAYTVENNGKILIRDIASGALIATKQFEDVDYRISVSPTGKYLVALRNNFMELQWMDLNKKTTEKRTILDQRKVPGLFLSEVFFLNDDMLIGTGRNSLNSANIKTSGIGNTGAWLGLIDTKLYMGSANLNITTSSAWMEGFGTVMAKPSTLTTVAFGYSDEYTFADPMKLSVRSGKLTDNREQLNQYLSAKLKRRMNTYSLNRNGSSSAADFNNPAIVATMFNATANLLSESDTFFLSFYDIQADSIIKATRLEMPNKEAHFYDLNGVLVKQGLSFFIHRFKNNAGSSTSELVIFNEIGSKVLTDSVVRNFNNRTIVVSPNQEYYAYQPNPSTLLVRSVKNHSVVHRINTGFSKYHYDVTGYANPRFVQSKPGMVVHEISATQNNNPVFRLMATDVIAKTSDTLFTFSLRPQVYEVDSTASTISLVYNYDFTDTAFTNTEVVQNAALHSFKPLYKPTVLLYSVAEKDITKAIHTGSNAVSSVSLKNNWLTVLHYNGQLSYINIQNTKQRLSHILDGESQALVADSFYYSSHNLLPLLNVRTAQGSFAATQADIFLNKPHQVLKFLNLQGNELVRPYEMAYQKRLSQHALPNQTITNLLVANKTNEVKGAQQHYIHTEERNIDLPFVIQSSAGLSTIKVILNGQPVSLYTGAEVKKIVSNKKLPFLLSSGENFVVIIGESADGKQTDPVKYYYQYEPKVYRAPKLFFFAAGVSDYKDSTYNLKYAAKDANDIFQAFRYKVSDTIISEILTDKQVTRKNIERWASQIDKAGVDDIVILYFAGHGLLDAKNSFYYAVHDMDFQKPEKNGISYEALLKLLSKSASRKKILLLDACHSGAFDRSVAEKVIQPVANNDIKVVSNERSTIKGAKPVYSERQAFVLMNQVFADLSADIGIDVIAASLGNSYALEQEDLQNGLFTYAMIRAVGLGMAANGTDGTKTVNMEQVKRFINQEVTRLSRGEQVPSIRASSVQSSSIEFHYSWKYDEAFDKFLERYK
jgi:hypothetical protein